MVRFVVYAEKEEDIGGLIQLLRMGTRARGEWALIQFYVGEEALPCYLEFVKRNPYLVMVVVSRGEKGRETAMRIRENNKQARMLWFSDRENDLYSYRVHVDCFGVLPLTQETIELALDSCGICPGESSGGVHQNGEDLEQHIHSAREENGMETAL